MKICIDAGHYGKYNRSPGNPNYYESEVMWKLHLLQKKYLEALGFEVIITRPEQNKDLELQARGNAANGCDLFISNHSNATGSGMNESIDYVAAYHLTADKTTLADDISKEIAEELAPIIADVMGTKQGYKVLTRKSGNDRNNDGVLNDNYYGVLHGARSVNVPGLILEHSFHTNSNAVKWLLNDSNLERLAKAEAEAIAVYFGISAANPGNVEAKLYRVQVGAFSNFSNAENMRAKVEKAGFDTCIVRNNNLYKVQVGAYSNRANADAMLAKVKNAGFDTIITTEGGEGVSSVVKKSIDEVAKEVIAGLWGNGSARRAKLEAAGYNSADVQKKVNELI